MRTISRWSFTFLKWLLILAMFSWLVLRLDLLWPYAIEQTYQQLDNDPGIEARLYRYSNLSASAGGIIDTVAPGVEGIDSIISNLKTLQAWDSLTSMAEKAFPGAKLAANLLDRVIGELARLRSTFRELQGLQLVATEVRNFRANPQQAELQILAESCNGPATEALSSIRVDIENLAHNLGSLNNHLDALLNALNHHQNPETHIGREVGKLYWSVREKRETFLQLEADIRFLQRDIHKDVTALQSIGMRVTTISTIDKVLNQIPALPQIRTAARNFWGHLDLAFHLAVVFFVSGWGFKFGDWLYEQRSKHRSSEVKVIVVPSSTSTSSTAIGGPRKSKKESRIIEPQAITTERKSPLFSPKPVPTPVRGVPAKSWLLQRKGESTSRTIPLPPQGKITIGSASGNELRVLGASVSAYHCAIAAARTCYFIQDLQSATGTALNGDYIEETRRLQHGDTILVGDVEFLFLCRDAMSS